MLPQRQRAEAKIAEAKIAVANNIISSSPTSFLRGTIYGTRAEKGPGALQWGHSQSGNEKCVDQRHEWDTFRCEYTPDRLNNTNGSEFFPGQAVGNGRHRRGLGICVLLHCRLMVRCYTSTSGSLLTDGMAATHPLGPRRRQGHVREEGLEIVGAVRCRAHVGRARPVARAHGSVDGNRRPATTLQKLRFTLSEHQMRNRSRRRS